MKTLKLLAVGIILLVSSASQAQVSVNLNIGSAPDWGPAGYSNVDYYYLPDVQSYYDVRESQFIYFGNGAWVRSRYLPRQYRNYDLYNGYKVVLNDYHGHRPYTYFNNHRRDYRVGYRGVPQHTIGHRGGNHNYNQHPYYSNERRYANNHRYAENRREYQKHDNRDHDNRDHDNHGNKGHGKH